MTELSDQSLLAHWYRHRNAEAFHVLATRHARMVYATALRVLRDAQAAEDVSQESFLALALAKRPPSRNVAAWLHRTAYRAALDVIRSGKRRQARDLDYAALQPQITQTTWDDMRGLVDEAVASLPEAWREPLVRHFFEQESHAAIAAALGIPRQTVTHRIGKGIEQVRQQLKDRGVIVPAGALLAAMIQENSAAALPMSAAAGIGRIALAATPSLWAMLETYTAGAAFKVAAAMLVVGAATTAVVLGGNLDRTRVPESPIAASDAVPEFEAPAARAVEAPPVVAAEAPIVEPSALSAEAFSIRGRVYDADTGAGISGATLQIYPTGGGTFVAKSEPTGPDGRYRFANVSDGSFTISLDQLQAYPDPRHRVSASVVLNGGQPASAIDFALKKGTPLTGIVVDENGKPVSGAEVGAKSERVVNPLKTTTGEDGRFVLYMPGAESSLMVQAQGSGRESMPQAGLALPAEGLADIALALDQPRTASVSGVIVDGDGAGVGGAQVYLQHKSDRVFPYAGRAQADASGAFQIAGCAAGEYSIIVTPEGADGYSSTEEYMVVSLAEGEQRNDIEIIYGEKGGLAIAGRVVNSEGDPVENATVTSFGTTMERAYTDGDGRFSITGLLDHAAAYAIEVEHRDYSRTNESATAGTLDLEIVLKRRGRIEGRVLRADNGDPLPAYRLSYTNGRVQSWGGFSSGAGAAVDSPDGTLSLPNLSVGDVCIAVYASGFAPEWQCIAVGEGAATPVEFRLQPAPVFEGSVVNEAGEAVPGAFVYYAESASLNQMDYISAARTDASGHYTIDSMPRDIPRLCAFADGYGVGVAEPPGDGRIVVQAPGVVEGAIEPGGLAPGAMIVNYFYPENSYFPNGYTHPDDDGTFRLAGLAPGRIQISVYPAAATTRCGAEYDILIKPGETINLGFAINPGSNEFEGVLRAGGEPVAAAWLRLERRKGTLTDYLRVVTGTDGTFRFEGAWAGELVLVITRVRPGDGSEVVTEEMGITIQEGETLKQDLEVAPL